jgi:hypothetical protein
MSWWEFGESSGYSGDKLATYQIFCPFCVERGHFKIQHHVHKENAAGKKLNYDVLECENCANLTMAFWSPARHEKFHNYLTIPPSRTTNSFPKHWPEDVGRHWLQAQRSIEGKNWDAASLMARSAVQLIMRYQKAKGSNLKSQIDDLSEKGILPPVMKDWAHEVRDLGNESAHPTPGAQGASASDAKDVVEFLGFLLRFTYNLPNDIAEFRKRRKGKDD